MLLDCTESHDLLNLFTMPMYICLIIILAVVFHPLLLTVKSMQLTLVCIFSHINNTYTIVFPLARADGMYHSENHRQLPHVNISYILFTNREIDGNSTVHLSANGNMATYCIYQKCNVCVHFYYLFIYFTEFRFLK